jgi:hypothetical protein
MENESYVVIVLVLAIAAIFVLPNLGLFSIFPVGEVGNLRVRYQSLENSCVVRLEKIPEGTTTWVGVYDYAGKGQSNINDALLIGWVNETTAPDLLELLQRYVPNENCNPVLASDFFHEADTNQDGIISSQELIAYSNRWIQGEVTRTKLAEAIDIWID